LSFALGGGRVIDFFMKIGISITWSVENVYEQSK